MSKIDDTIKQVRKQVDKEQAILVTNPLKFKKALCKYMPLQEYASFKEGKSLLAENNAIAFRDLIYKYKSTVSKKSGKPMKHDIRDKAIVDIMDGLEKYAVDGLDDKLEPKGFKAGLSKNCVYMGMEYNGNICLPFKECLIYSRLKDITSVIIDIKDNLNGVYTGNFYGIDAGNMLVQYKFEISRINNHWFIGMEFAKRLKPLGQDLCNMGVLVRALSSVPEKVFDWYTNIGRGNFVSAYMAEDCKAFFSILSYLSSYKSKNLYEVNGESSYFLYSNNSEDVDDYIKNYYPNHTYNKVEGWIIDGYYKMLSENEFGLDRNGKKLKGFDWVVPYKNDYKEEQKQMVKSNGQTSTIVPIHAIERAKQRYNLDLTTDDLNNIAKEVLAGHNIKKLAVRDKLGRLYSSKNELGCYRLKYKNRLMDVVLSRCIDVDSYRVATFLPEPKDPNVTIVDSKDYASVMEDCSV